MEAYILDNNFEVVSIVDSYISFIWTDRYNKAGDFELYMPTSAENIARFVHDEDYYLWDKESEHLMIIEDIQTKSDIEEGNNMTVVGRSLESLLERRIIWNRTEIEDGSPFQSCVETLINNNISNSPSNNVPGRQISNFIFSRSSESAITSLTVDAAQYEGDNLYEVICKLCEDKHIGFKVTLNDDKQFVFKLYAGVNRSYSQPSGDNPFVVFSPHFENIVNSEYNENKSKYKNTILVAGEDDGDAKIRETAVSKSGVSGINRREMYLSSSLSTNNGEISETTYRKQLKEEGKE